jgi:N6-L-threonylcarbamoyladenine synthase
MKILAIETSCDETAAAVVESGQILSSIKYTQEIHAAWGGVVPSLAKRAHQERIDSVIDKAIQDSGLKIQDMDAIAVTVGPGLAIALGVGIAKAKELAVAYNKPLIAVNHIEGHILSALTPDITFPCLALAISGGHTQVILIKKIGEYQILVESQDDNIGEAIDKGARILGLPYPGGPALEKLAAEGNFKKYKLPLPMAGKEGHAFSYSGLKSAFFRLVQQFPDANKADLAACYQAMVFKHLIRTLKYQIENCKLKIENLLVGGGVAANQTLRHQIEELGHDMGFSVHYPENSMLCTDNAAMIGITACHKYERKEFNNPEEIDRLPRWKVDQNVIDNHKLHSKM